MDSPEVKSEVPFSKVPVEVRVTVGRARPLIRDLLAFGPDAVIQLDKKVDDPVELFVGDRLIARGILEEAENGPEGQLAVRLIEVADVDNALD